MCQGEYSDYIAKYLSLKINTWLEKIIIQLLLKNVSRLTIDASFY